MFIQDQLPASRVDDENLSFFKAIGVDYLTINPPPFAATGHGAQPQLAEPGDLEDYLRRTKALAESHGLKLQNIAFTGPDEVTLAGLVIRLGFVVTDNSLACPLAAISEPLELTLL